MPIPAEDRTSFRYDNQKHLFTLQGNRWRFQGRCEKLLNDIVSILSKQPTKEGDNDPRRA